MSIFTKVWIWIKKEFGQFESFAVHHIAPLAIAIGEEVKETLDNGTVVEIIDVIAAQLKVQGVADEIIAVFKLNAPRLISFGLILEAPPTNATPEQMGEWTSKLFNTWSTNKHLINRGQFFTVFTAQMAQIIEALTQKEQTSFGDWAVAVQQGWMFYQEDIKDYEG